MQSYSRDQLKAALDRVGVSPGQTLLVHSSLFHLGRMAGVSSADLPPGILGALRDAVGEEGTIAVPAFSFAFCRGTKFSRGDTPSEQMGAFSEFVRRQPDACRSPHPMQSISAIGPNAKRICSNDTTSSFSDSGAFDQLLRLDAQVLLLGATMQAVSLIHYVEERENVPYRYWKSFTGEWQDGDLCEQRSYQMFVRDLDKDPRLVLSPLHDDLLSSGRLKSAELGAGQIMAFGAAEFVALAHRRLSAYPLALLENKEQ